MTGPTSLGVCGRMQAKQWACFTGSLWARAGRAVGLSHRKFVGACRPGSGHISLGVCGRVQHRSGHISVGVCGRVQAKPKRKRVEQEYRAPTQEELLAEAAETEILNLKDLANMVAQEEEVKKKSEVLKVHNSVPLIRIHSVAKPKGQAVVRRPLPTFLHHRIPSPPVPAFMPCHVGCGFVYHRWTSEGSVHASC